MLRVWVDGWQVQCCGEPFAVGDTVRWTLVERVFDDVLTDSRGRREQVHLTHAEEHHGAVPEDVPPTEARLTRIQAVTFAYADVPGRYRTQASVAGSGRAQQLWRVDGWESERQAEADRRFAGYVVDLEVADA